ncbi:MAG: SAM-dependent methyltransferase [Verrucomicrobiota bacterium]
MRRYYTFQSLLDKPALTAKNPRMTPIEQFVEHTRASLAAGTFVRLTLTRPVGQAGLEKLLARPVDLKGQPHLSLTLRYPTRDETQNIPVEATGDWLREQLAGKFRGALLGTTTRDWQWTGKRLIEHKPVATAPPGRGHDRPKAGHLDESAQAWLTGLGVLNTDGSVRPSMADKFAQMNRYLEIVAPLAKEAGTIVDMGCGKGYLTFALWHALRVKVIGVEQRPELVTAANTLARQIGATGLEFSAGTITSAEVPTADALIALHACNTATDDAIRRGVKMGAKLIVVAPCCHQEVRPQLGKPEPLTEVLKHGLMSERMAEWATDGLRVLFLEWAGYRTKVIEFVDSGHTPKNLMIVGIRDGKPLATRAKIEQFKKFFGIQHHALDDLGRD